VVGEGVIADGGDADAGVEDAGVEDAAVPPVVAFSGACVRPAFVLQDVIARRTATAAELRRALRAAAGRRPGAVRCPDMFWTVPR
jgi:hypothetical protein